MHQTIALIPLRGGSKSIPKKNIKTIAGKPLCAWVLEAASNAAIFDKIIVSTDSEEIATVVEGLNLNVEVLMRPAHLATDTASTEAVMLHIKELVDFQTMVLIQATSPLVSADDFIKANKIFIEDELDSLLSTVVTKRFFWTPDAKPINYDPLDRPRRQDFAGIHMENGAFYFTKKAILDNYKCRLGGKIGLYEMEEDSAIEIDEPEDWILVEELLLKRDKSGFLNKLKNIKLLAMDCDGVLTDAGMYYSNSGEELKKFNTRDGHGLGLLRETGIKTAIITGEESQLVANRAEKLKIDDLFMGVTDKSATLDQLLRKYNLQEEEVAYIGDDLNDLPVMNRNLLSFAVQDAVLQVKKQARYILNRSGGKGSVREVCDLIIGFNNKR